MPDTRTASTDVRYALCACCADHTTGENANYAAARAFHDGVPSVSPEHDEACLCGEIRDDDCGHPDCPIARPENE